MGRRAGWLTPVLVLLLAVPAAASAADIGPGGALPDRVYVPPEHATELEPGESFESVGVLMNEVNDDVAVVGADTGAYRYTPLELLASALNGDDGRFGLSADGSRLAWVQPEGPVVVRIWDTATGDVLTHQLDGVFIQAAPVMLMSPDGTAVAMPIGDTDGNRVTRTTTVMDADTGDVRSISGCPRLLGWSQPDELLCDVDGSLVARSLRGPGSRTLGAVGDATWPVRLSPDGRRAVAPSASDPEVPVLLDLSAGAEEPAVDTAALSGRVLGWADDETVVLARADTGVVAVSLADGSTETMVDVPADLAGVDGFAVPAGLLGRPTYAASEPDWPLHPRWLIIGVIVAILVAVGGLLGLMELAGRSRRRRPR